MAVEKTLPHFTTIIYKTSDGENCSATKNNGVVTIQGDKNGVRQMPLDDFMPYFIEDQSKIKLDKTPQKDTVSFSGNNTTPEKKTGGSGKAWASVFIPGLGQFLDGRNKEGAGYLIGGTALGIGSRVLFVNALEDAVKAACTSDVDFDISKYCSKLTKGKFIGAIALGLAGTALWIANIVDAYKGGKK